MSDFRSPATGFHILANGFRITASGFRIPVSDDRRTAGGVASVSVDVDGRAVSRCRVGVSGEAPGAEPL